MTAETWEATKVQRLELELLQKDRKIRELEAALAVCTCGAKP